VTRTPTPGNASGDVVEAQTSDWQSPVYVDWEDVLAALERIRCANRNGYGYLETIAPPDGSSAPPRQEPWLSTPFADETTGRPLGTGDGVLLPLVIDWDGATKLLGGDSSSPGRTHAAIAAFTAFAVALAQGAEDGMGAALPAVRGSLLGRAVFDPFVSTADEIPEDAAVSAVVAINAGVRVKKGEVRRGDLLQVVWSDGGTHPVWCWDVRRQGDDVWVQVVSAQASTHGLGVLLSPLGLGAAGALEPVRRAGDVSLQLVHRADPGKAWLTNVATRAFTTVHGHWIRLPAKDGDAGLTASAVHVGRFHRRWPRYPIALGGSDAVATAAGAPTVGPKGALVAQRSRDAGAALYYANNEGSDAASRQGGFYPVGAGRTWHGGIHLYPEKDDAIRAPVDGVLVAARLSVDANASAYGDVGFVLLKTTLTVEGQDAVFFTLLMHLAPWSASDTPAWYADLAKLPPDDDPLWSAGLDAEKSYVRVLAAPKGAQDRAGADGPDGALLVFEKRDRGSSQRGTIATGSTVECPGGLDAHGWAKVTGSVEGWVYGPGRLESVPAFALDRKLKEKRASLAKGEAVDLSDVTVPIVVRAGEVVGRVGTTNRDRAIHVEIFSSDMIPVLGKTAPDIDLPDTDLFTDHDKFDDVFFKKLDDTKEGGQGKDVSIRAFMLPQVKSPDDHPSAGEVLDFYSSNVLRARFRTLVTRHPSEWSDAVDWKQLDSSPAWKHVSAEARKAFQDEVAKFVWWKKGFLSSQGLPQDQVVHHYHPVTFLAWLDEKRENDADGSLHLSVFDKNHGT